MNTPTIDRFKNWLEERIENYEAEKELHGKKERIQARLQMLKETLENYNRWASLQTPSNDKTVGDCHIFIIEQSGEKPAGEKYSFDEVAELLKKFSSQSTPIPIITPCVELEKEVERLKGLLIKEFNKSATYMNTKNRLMACEKFKTENNL